MDVALNEMLSEPNMNGRHPALDFHISSELFSSPAEEINRDLHLISAFCCHCAACTVLIAGQ